MLPLRSLTPVKLIGQTIAPSVHALVPFSVLKKHRAVPFAYEAARYRGRGTLVVAMADPDNLAALDELAFASGLAVRAVLADAGDICTVLGLGGGAKATREEPPPDIAIEPIELAASDDDPTDPGWFLPVADSRCR